MPRSVYNPPESLIKVTNFFVPELICSAKERTNHFASAAAAAGGIPLALAPPSSESEAQRKMSLNLMGLFQRPFMDWFGGPSLSLSLSLSFIPSIAMARFMDLSPLSLSFFLSPRSQNRSIVAKCDFQSFPPLFTIRAEPRASARNTAERSANDGQ